LDPSSNKENTARTLSFIDELNSIIQNQPTSEEHFDRSIKDASDQVESSATGIEDFDHILQGGFPKGAVVLLAGSSGSGKTIFSLQWLFEGIRRGEPGVYLSLTEPLFKIVQNLEKMNFYQRDAIEQEQLRILDFRDRFSGIGYNPKEILEFIEEQIKETHAKRLCIDSITAIAYQYNDKVQIRTFIFELGKILAALGCTTILTSEVATHDMYSIYEVEEFISDAILRLDQIRVKNDFQRQLTIIKVRGKSFASEAIPMKISNDGIKLFPKIKPKLSYGSSTERTSTGNINIDEMLHGGLIQGSTTLAVGATGTGKTLLSLQFLVNGLQKNEHCVYFGFEESREQLIRNAKSFGWNLEDFEEQGLLTIRCVYPNDFLLEEHFKEIAQIFRGKKVSRCVVDSLSALAHAFGEDDFSNFSVRLNGYLKSQTVTTVFTATAGALIGSAQLAEYNLSTLTDCILMLRYVEMQGSLESVISVVKMRGSQHCKNLRQYTISDKGIVVGESLSNYEGVMTGVSKKIRELQQESERLKQIISEKEQTQAELMESKNRLKIILDSMQAGVTIIDATSHKIIDVNTLAASMIGLPKHQIIGNVCQKFICPSDLGNCPVSDLGQHVDNSKRCMLTADGKKIPILKTVVPIILNGAPHFLESFVDISKLEEAQLALKSSEERFRDISESMGDCIWEVDNDFRYTYVSDKVKNILGFDSTEMMGKTPFDLMTHEEAHRVKESLSVLLAQQHPIIDFKNWAVRKDGKTVCLLTNGKPLFDSQGFIGYRGVNKDITEWMEAENNVKESERKFRSIFESLQNIYYRTDLEGIIQIISPSVFDIAGYTPDELIGRPATDVYYHSEDRQTLLEVLTKQGKVQGFELTLLKKNGEKAYTSVNSHLVFNEQRRPIAIEGTLTDITALKQKEKELEEAQKILSIINKQLQIKISEQTEKICKEKNMYQTLFENIPQKIFQKNTDFKYVFANENFLKDVGMDISDIIGKTDWDLFPMDLATKYNNDDRMIVEKGEVFTTSESYIKKGEKIMVTTVKAPIKDNEGHLTGILGIFWETPLEKRPLIPSNET
jgi:circadian clock protein KaiC